jgi:hypothetical protein
MANKEFIKRAVQLESNAFIYNSGAAAEGESIAPNVWDVALRDFEEKALIVTPLAEQFDFRKPGQDLTVTVDDRPSAAGALTETVDVTISAFTTRQVTFTPVEQGAAYQLTRGMAARGFFDIAERMVRKLGYSLAERKDTLAVSELQTGAGAAVIANGKSATSDLAATDFTSFLTDLSSAMYEIRQHFYKPKFLLINAYQEHKLRTHGTTITLADASQFGTREMIERGFVGRLFGLEVYTSDTIAATSNVAKAIVLGASQTGENALAYAIKRDPIIEKEYHARGRYWDIVAHEEYDFVLIHPDAVCTLATYSA